MDVPFESAGFADMELFGPVMIAAFFVMVAVLAISVGEISFQILLATHRSRSARLELP